MEELSAKCNSKRSAWHYKEIWMMLPNLVIWVAAIRLWKAPLSSRILENTAANETCSYSSLRAKCTKVSEADTQGKKAAKFCLYFYSIVVPLFSFLKSSGVLEVEGLCRSALGYVVHQNSLQCEFRLVHCSVVKLEVKWNANLPGSIQMTPVTTPASRILINIFRWILSASA